MRPLIVSLVVLIFASPLFAFMSDDAISVFQQEIRNLPIGERISLWAEKFVGAPYDPDPMGEYVTKQAVVADERVDCMYLTFRSVELALALTPKDAVSIALDKRFITKGKMEGDNLVLNYDERFEYGEDMINSGKFGRDITNTLGYTSEMNGSRGTAIVAFIPKRYVFEIRNKLESGDIVYFIKEENKRVAGEIVGHIGIIKKEGKSVYLLHASGKKYKGGEVKKLPLLDYTVKMPFVGIKVSRIE